MRSAIFLNGKKFRETDIKVEEEFEESVKENSKTLFGQQTVYFDLKNKVESKTMGSSIPDGFMFDFADIDNPEFYLVEVELKKHDFYNHIFPQVTKFFAFFKNPVSRNSLIERLFHHIKANHDLEEELKQYLGKKEIYKAIKDIIESSQNILLIMDDYKQELDEVLETYTDTWDKMVTVEILKIYSGDNQTILTLSPDFEDVGLVAPPTKESEGARYTETFHTEDVEKNVEAVYEAIRNHMLRLDPDIKLNAQKYYISLRKSRNFAFLKFRKKKMVIVVMLPFETGQNIIRRHTIKQLSESIQDFYNGPCFKVSVEDIEGLDEVLEALKQAYLQQNK
jgi:predicted transport protein